MFVLEAIINQIHAEYTAINGTTVEVELGNLEKAKNATTPRIVWTLTGGRFLPPLKIGGVDAEQALANASFFIWLWFDDLEQCWNAMTDLLAAARRTVYGPNLLNVDFTCPTQVEGRHTDKGQVIVLTLALSVPMPVDGTSPSPEIELQSHESVVTEDNGVADQDGNFAPFETAIVTGPPA